MSRCLCRAVEIDKTPKTHVHTYIHMCICTCMNICIYYIYTCMDTSTYKYTCIYTHTYKVLHLLRQSCVVRPREVFYSDECRLGDLWNYIIRVYLFKDIGGIRSPEEFRRETSCHAFEATNNCSRTGKSAHVKMGSFQTY